MWPLEGCEPAAEPETGQSRARRVVNLRILVGLEGCSWPKGPTSSILEGSKAGGTEPERRSGLESEASPSEAEKSWLGLRLRGGGLRLLLSSVLALALGKSFDVDNSMFLVYESKSAWGRDFLL